jgi:hypothetical protein
LKRKEQKNVLNSGDQLPPKDSRPDGRLRPALGGKSEARKPPQKTGFSVDSIRFKKSQSQKLATSIDSASDGQDFAGPAQDIPPTQTGFGTVDNVKLEGLKSHSSSHDELPPISSKERRTEKPAFGTNSGHKTQLREAALPCESSSDYEYLCDSPHPLRPVAQALVISDDSSQVPKHTEQSRSRVTTAESHSSLLGSGTPVRRDKKPQLRQAVFQVSSSSDENSPANLMAAVCGFGSGARFKPKHPPPTLDSDPDDEGAFCLTGTRSQRSPKQTADAKHETPPVRKADVLSKGSRAFVVRPRAADQNRGETPVLPAREQEADEAPRTRLTAGTVLSKYCFSDTEEGGRDYVNATLNLSELNGDSDSF